MRYTILGRTGLRVSVMGLGCGGHSRLGQSYGAGPQESAAVIQRALDLGVNLFDTAEGYGTEEIVGEGLRLARREGIVISTKKTTAHGETPVRPDEVAPALEESLRRLGTDYVDIYHLHGLAARHYDYALAHLVPELQRLRQQGKLRYIGLTEAFGSDPQHMMLQRALQDACWDVVMVGLNLLNQSARERVLPAADSKSVGVLVMFALRRALSDPVRLREVIADLQRRKLVDAQLLGDDEPLDFLVHAPGATSVQDAAYRFCRHEPGVHVVLSGTGDPEHLEANAVSLCRPPLPAEDVARLRALFGAVDDVSGN